MKAMIFSDLITSKNSFPTLLGMTLLIAVFIAIPTESLYGSIGACAAMIPFMYLFSISAYDEQNGWERYRLTLPITRRQVAYGRYASLLIVCACSFVLAVLVGCAIGLVADMLPGDVASSGLRLSSSGVAEVVGTALLTQVIILLVAALTMPFILRYGMTKGTRIAPVLLIFVITGAIVFASNTPFVGDLEVFISAMGMQGIVILLIAALGAVLVLYFISSFIAARLYEQREL